MDFKLSDCRSKVCETWAPKAFADKKVELSEIKEFKKGVLADGKIDSGEIQDARMFQRTSYPITYTNNGKKITVDRYFDVLLGNWEGEKTLRSIYVLEKGLVEEYPEFKGYEHKLPFELADKLNDVVINRKDMQRGFDAEVKETYKKNKTANSWMLKALKEQYAENIQRLEKLAETAKVSPYRELLLKFVEKEKGHHSALAEFAETALD
jgi:hypothetical protein